MIETRVYAIGKIEKNGWRNGIVPGLRDTWQSGGDSLNDSDAWPETKIKSMYGEVILYTGPYFASDDHGCYHMDNGHGVAAGSAACGDAYSGLNRKTTHVRCLAAIDASDHIFAWIDDATAHGSLVEIGYALAKGKKLFVYFDAAKRAELLGLWFAAQGASYFGWRSSAKEAWDHYASGGDDDWG